MFKALILGSLFASAGVSAIEQPAYTVVKDLGNGIELRQYSSYLIAETRISADNADMAGNLAFKRLGGYIFGGNKSKTSIAMTAPVSQARSEKIEMTAPVSQARSSDGTWLVSFVMPKRYTLESLPVPNDPSVYFKSVPARKVLAVRFSGRWTDANFKAHENALLTALAGSGMQAIGSPWSARYDPPFMPGFMRRNEIMIQVR